MTSSQTTQNGDRTVRKEVRLVLKKYALSTTNDLFDAPTDERTPDDPLEDR